MVCDGEGVIQDELTLKLCECGEGGELTLKLCECGEGGDNLLLNSANVVRVVIQDTWLESGQAAMCRSGERLLGQSSHT